MNEKTILIVDDEPIVLRVTELTFNAAGYSVIKARNAEEALRFCEEMKDNLLMVVSDVSMPGMSGLELANCISHSSYPVPVILMSGYVERGNCLAESTDWARNSKLDFIRKPFKPKDLLNLVELMLDSPRV